MRPAFWTDRWLSGRIGFHKAHVEPFLAKHWAEFGFGECARVFAPLSGKSVDLLWLREHGNEVVGVELSEIAVEAFFSENGIPARRRAHPGFDRYQSLCLELLRGDFFELTAELLGNVSVVYDRAALTSWAPDLRTRYVEHLTAIVPRVASILLIALEYPPINKAGPPFSITLDEVRRLYSGPYRIFEHSRRDISASDLKLSAGVAQSTYEVLYHLVPKS